MEKVRRSLCHGSTIGAAVQLCHAHVNGARRVCRATLPGASVLFCGAGGIGTSEPWTFSSLFHLRILSAFHLFTV